MYDLRMILVALMILTLSFGCGADSTPAASDASISNPDGAAGFCNPVTQQGCDLGQKCAHLVHSKEPYLATTACVPNGNVEPQGACVLGEAGATTGFDSCQATMNRGYHCLNGICTEVCDTGTCNDGNCVSIDGVFASTGGNTGICTPSCDVTIQDCDDQTMGCYLTFAQGAMSCSAVSETAAGLAQGDPCYSDDGTCYFNACSIGYGAVLNASPTDGASVCAFFCNPSKDNLLGDPSGIQVNFDGGGIRGPGPAFVDANGGFECRWINTFYNNAGDVPDTIGMAVPSSVWGSCADHVPGDPENEVVGCQPLSELSMSNRQRLERLPTLAPREMVEVDRRTGL